MDFSKAFDKVPKFRLLAKLEAHGICGNVLTWIGTWLTNRKQRTVLNGEFSDWADVESGVPQGSVLGPLCFVVYINDIDDSATATDLINIFADDTKVAQVIRGQEDREKLQSTLDNLTEWADKWGMSFNTGKCKVMHIGRNNSKFDYKMDGVTLSKTNFEKDIGVMVTDNLKPHKHCEEAVRKANGVLGQISRSFHYRDKNTFITLIWSSFG